MTVIYENNRLKIDTEPIIVRKSRDIDGKYEIIAGERRWLASQNAGLNEIPVVVIEADDIKALEFGIVENVQILILFIVSISLLLGL